MRAPLAIAWLAACSRASSPLEAPPPHCGAVAEDLTSLELGNYAPEEERAPVVAKFRAACVEARITAAEAECLGKAKDLWTAAQCAPRMFPELAAAGTDDCRRVADKVRASYGTKADEFRRDPTMSKWFDTTMRIIQESCEQDRWPDSIKRCILGSTASTDALQGCNQAFPASLQQKLQERMVAAMKQITP